MVYGTYNYSYWGLNTNKHHWGPSHCIYMCVYTDVHWLTPLFFPGAPAVRVQRHGSHG